MFDQRKITSWWDYVEEHDVRQAPFAALASKGPSSLVVLCTEQVGDPRGPSYGMISEAVGGGGVALRIQGLPYGPLGRIRQVDDMAEQAEGTPSDVDIFHAVRCATEAGVPYGGLDAAAADVVAGAGGKGIPPVDVAGFDLLQQAVQAAALGGGRVGDPPAPIVDAIVTPIREAAPEDDRGAIEAFKTPGHLARWFERRAGVAFERADAAVLRPGRAEGAALCDLTNDLSDVRERLTNTAIAETLGRTDGPLVVLLSKSSLFMQRRAIEAGLGKLDYAEDVDALRGLVSPLRAA